MPLFETHMKGRTVGVTPNFLVILLTKILVSNFADFKSTANLVTFWIFFRFNSDIVFFLIYTTRYKFLSPAAVSKEVHAGLYIIT